MNRYRQTVFYPTSAIFTPPSFSSSLRKKTSFGLHDCRDRMTGTLSQAYFSAAAATYAAAAVALKEGAMIAS